MTKYDIQFEEGDTSGRAFLQLEGETKAEMTFSKAGESILIIDHTEVAADLKGQGVGRQLLDKIVAIVREQGKSIIPLCPFAKSVFDKDESIRDVLRK